MIVQSKLITGIPLELNTSNMEFSNIVYMCIKQANNSEYHIPDNLEYIVNRVISSIYRSSDYLYQNDWKYNCYLTIKHSYVSPQSTDNRPGWHIDGFKSDQHNFIWFDSIQTEVCAGIFDLTNDHDISLEEMHIQSIENDKFIHTLTKNTLYEMDHNCVHRPSYNKTDKAILRTFIKITYSTEMFNCIGNAWNYKLPHIRYNKTRNEIRNHTVL